MNRVAHQARKRRIDVTTICITEDAIERCAVLTSIHDLAALSEGTLSIEGRFRLARHIRRCLTCKLMLLILLDEVERHGGPGVEGVKAVAMLTEVDSQRMSDWLLAMFCNSGCNGNDE